FTQKGHYQIYNLPPGTYQMTALQDGFNSTGLTRPTFCTRASERVYITTSSGKDANGGSQGAVGDRRVAICGENAPGAGGLYPSAECGRLVLYSTRHFS